MGVDFLPGGTVKPVKFITLLTDDGIEGTTSASTCPSVFSDPTFTPLWQNMMPYRHPTPYARGIVGLDKVYGVCID